MSFLAQISKLFGSKTSAVVAATAPKAKNASRSVAKERLSVILASQRGSELMAGVDMVLLQQDVLAVVKRHIQVANNSPVNCQIRNEGEVNLFEMAVEVDVNGRRSSSVSIQA